MRNLIVAVDPGGTTGYSFTEWSDEMPEAGIMHTPKVGQLPPQEFCDWVYDLATQWGPLMTIVCERFTIGQRTLRVAKGGSYDALDVIGFLRWVSLHYLSRDLEMQQPSEVMNMFPDSWLKERGWYANGLGHANDSQRHLARALAKRKLIRVGSV